jgi:hypothetical protein
MQVGVHGPQVRVGHQPADAALAAGQVRSRQRAERHPIKEDLTLHRYEKRYGFFK